MTLLELYDMAEQNHVEVDAFDLGEREALSLMDEGGQCYIAIDPFKLQSSIDEKQKLTHELGHCVQGAFYNPYSTHDIVARHEKRADKWAIKKLVPQNELERAVKQGYIEIYDLAEYFDVTEDFMRKAVCWYKYGSLDTEYYFS